MSEEVAGSSATPYNFEARVPIDHIRGIVTIFRSGEAATKKGPLGELCGAAIGEASAIVTNFEGGDPVIGACPEDLPTTIEGAISRFEEILEAYDAQPAGADGPSRLSPEMWALIIQIARLVLDSWLNS